MLRLFHERPLNLLMISARERNGRTIGLKYMAWHSLQLL